MKRMARYNGDPDREWIVWVVMVALLVAEGIIEKIL